MAVDGKSLFQNLAVLLKKYELLLSVTISYYEGRPESKDRLAIKKNKQNKNKINISLLQTLSYFST
jgi:hypothetical protein